MADTKISALSGITDAAHGDSLAIVDTSAGATKKVDFAEIASPNKGVISVHSDDATQIYRATADGSTDDRAVILSAFTYAIANMPCSIEFGPGDYAISGGVRVRPAQGASGLSICGAGPNVTRLKFAKGSVLSAGQQVAIDIAPSVTPTVGNYNDYLQDITVKGIGFYDNDPVTHAGAEESHGLLINYARNAHAINISVDSIGDEGVDFSNVIGGSIESLYGINTPSVGSYGASISISGGCTDVTVIGGHIYGTSTKGTKSTVTGAYGIDIAVVAGATMSDIEQVTVIGTKIYDLVTGIVINCADTTNNSDIHDTVIQGTIILNCTTGILRTGSNGVSYKTSIVGNIIKTMSDVGIDFAVDNDENYDAAISFNQIHDVQNNGMMCNGTRLNLSGNIFRTADKRAIYVWDGYDITIQGGQIDNCGTDGAYPCIHSENASRRVLIDGVRITNAACTSFVIRNIEIIENCYISQDAPFNRQILYAQKVTDNVINGGIDIHAGAGRVVSGNMINVGGEDIGGFAIFSTNAVTNSNIINNTIDTTNGATLRRAINIAAGDNYNIVVGNNAITDTPGSGIVDAGTGTTLANNHDL